MKGWLTLAGGLLIAAAPAPKPALLIVGLPHFGNPGHDTVNTRVPDVLGPGRQREIAAVVDRLAAFRPTRVAVEWPADSQAELDRRYADYRAGRRALSANERWRAWVGRFQAQADADARLMACTPVSAWLRRVNTPAYRLANHRTYYYVARIGDAGAAWVGTWYTRNLRILGNLMAITPGPRERIVAIYGAGHGYLLDQQARESAAFAVADTLAWLPRSSRDAWTRCPG